MYKASGSLNTQAVLSLGAGIGYQFGTNEIVDVNDIKNVLNKHSREIKELQDKIKIWKKDLKRNQRIKRNDKII